MSGAFSSSWFPDGQLFLDLHAYTQGFCARDTGEALECLLQALGVSPWRVPHDLEQRAGLCRQHVMGKRLLIVLDNAVGEAQVRPLLPGRIAASLLRHRPAWTIENLADRLRDAHQRVAALSDGDRDLRAAFDLSFKYLTADQQRLFRCIALMRDPVTDVQAVAARANIDIATADDLLEALVDHHLRSQPSPGHYSVHELNRLHAARSAERADFIILNEASCLLPSHVPASAL